MQNYGTIWVCQCCMLTHANGECCSDLYYGQDPDHDPLSSIGSGFTVAMGMAYSEHDEECGNYFPEGADTTQASGNIECDCETNTYSTSPCQGCGSWLHGERHAMTLFKD